MISFFSIAFITFKWIDAIDIILVAILLYQVYSIVKGTPAVNIFTGIFSIYVVWIVVRALDMKLFGSILGKFIDVGVIAIIVVFQQELRRFLLFIGTQEFISRSFILKTIFSPGQGSEKNTQMDTDINTLTRACFHMSEQKTGALIVLSRHSDLKFYINTGEPLDAVVTERMLESIFYKNSPLHDGAVIISNNRIIAARCVLPVTEKEQFPSHYGMRHRAAVGITETTDAIALVVSEQTGGISMAINGDIKLITLPEKLKQLLEKELRK